MLDRIALCVLSLLASAELAKAHGYVYSWTVNGETRRGPSPGSGSNGAGRPTDNSNWGPADRDSAIVACGGASAGSGLQTWDVDAGSEVIAQWTGTKNGNSVWPPEHLGPVMEYMAKCPGSSCDGVAADSLDWFKISEATWDGTEWPSAKINRDADWSFTIPSDIAPGAYLVRTEIIAMHFEWAKKGFEVYPYCFQANVIGSGNAVPSDTTTFPAAYDPTSYEWYDYSYPWDNRDPAQYVPPGPAVYGGGGSPAPTNGNTTSPSATSAPTSSVADDEEQPSSTRDQASSATGQPVVTDSADNGSGSPITASAVESSAVVTDSAGTSSTRTRGWWRNWRSRTSSAAAAAETSATTEDEEAETEDEEEDSDYRRRRSVVERYSPRQLGNY